MSSSLRVALATCADLPDWEVDDEPLREALRERAAVVDDVPWEARIDWSSYDGCLIRTTWDYMERWEGFARWADETARVTRLFNPPGVVRWNLHKGYLRELEARGAPVVPTVWLPAGEAVDIAALVAERGWGRAFLKPQVGASARETLRFDADAEGLARAQAHADRLLVREDLMLQPYCAAVETEGEVSAILVEGALAHGVRKVPVSGDYRVQDDYGAHDEPYRFEDAELALVERIAGLVEPGLLYGRVDLLRADDGDLKLIELELVEPSLFLRHGQATATLLAEALTRRISEASVVRA